MLQMFEARTPQGALQSFPLFTTDNGFLVQDIQGLDPVKATIVSSSFARMDGEQYQSSRREKRNMVIKLGLEPDFVEMDAVGLRNRLYEFFMPEATVNLRFYMSSGLTVDIQGKVEAFDCPMFSKDIEATITILCMEPDFFNPVPVNVEGFTTSGDEEFLINYDGSIETGIEFRIDADRALPQFTIYHRPVDNVVRSLEFDSDLLAGDSLSIITIPGRKSVFLTRLGAISSVLYGVSPYSNWITLYPGPNFIRVHAEGAPVPFSIEYTKKYGGL